MLERTSGLLAVDDRLKDDIEQGYSVLLGEKVALDSVRRLIVDTWMYVRRESSQRVPTCQYIGQLVFSSGDGRLTIKSQAPK